MTTEELLKTIGKNIRTTRGSRDISQHDLAAACNYEKSNMNRIEAGRTNVTIGTINKIAIALNVSPKALLP